MFYKHMALVADFDPVPLDELSSQEAGRPVIHLEHRAAVPAMDLKRRGF